MTALTNPGLADTRPHAIDRLANASLGFVVFLSGFVLFEPAPYELALLAVMAAWIGGGLRLNRHTWPLIALLVALSAGGLLAVAQAREFGEALIHQLVTIFLAASAIFYASAIAVTPQKRITTILLAYIAGAVVVALFGIVTFFELLPGSVAFKVNGRAAGTFQDPNVFGPFLALPAVYLAVRLLTGSIRRPVWAVAAFTILLGGIFLSFSRGAWGLFVVSTLIASLLTFASQRDGRGRRRVAVFLLVLAVGGVALVVFAASLPAVSGLLQERAQFVQFYDGGQGGRFARWAIGFVEVVPYHPLGIGPEEFGIRYGGDEHNTWLKGFTVYGWMGGFAYIALAVWTLLAAFPLLFRSRPWQPALQATYAVFVGHLALHMVIDVDHWRHMFLIYGLLWGLIAFERTARAAHAPPPAGVGRPASPQPASVVERAPPRR